MDYSTLISPSLGILVGILMGLTGAGGGILSVPLLIFFLGLPIAEAAPIALCAVALASSIGAILGLKNKILRYKAAIFMALFGLILSPIGLWLTSQIPNAPLQIVFSFILLYVAINLFFQARNELKGVPEVNRKPPPCLILPTVGKLQWTMPCARALMLSGSIAGFLSGLLGVGGGFIIVPALRRYTDLPVKSIVATSLGVLAIITGGGAIFSAASGNLNLMVAAPFSIAALVGLLLGQLLGKKISGPNIQLIFAIFTLLVAISLLIKGALNLRLEVFFH
ncbi:sulfite exporter TauE/SafE family protein [Polynucleobacter sp. JS-Mosq-20-D10]|uniref:sulfite exporter TauE/SafE family protein n=1 Tax=Polynucleobacter sp. JS-Mosq-20-D10 TaxID=2576922 RepID=UPI001BFED241|nr:sulfite exporter TauE/SafE family protein [Polynucleobacter sp. JS-Mosq-20-D10]QWE00816.1 sulfite exporter TauE/SafE family protein [Polynucleobacter sp. JS-Mosq-20-D10]